MKVNKKFRNSLIIGILVIGAIATWYFMPKKTTDGITTKVKSGKFLITVTTSGELDSKSSTEILGPTGMRSLGIYENLKLNHIIDEGTIVDSGAYIAAVDQTPILNRMKEVDANLEKLSATINQSKLDSALTLRADRDNLENLKFSIHELEVELENSAYESPVTIEKLKNSLEKAKRQYSQALTNYKLKKQKEENTVRTAMIDYQKEVDKKDRYLEVLSEFTIKAPQSGMLIYARTWSGKKITSGSEINLWDPQVAELPDLSQMNVKTYVNEVDISKVKVGQKVDITVDAFPDKKLRGVVTSVANIGEEMQNSSAHVFEVIIEVKDKDPDLRPAMTTKNTIIIETLDSAIYIPIECINTKDGVSFVYSNGKKIKVKAGKSNDDEIQILEGLKGDEVIYLVPPEGANEWGFKY